MSNDFYSQGNLSAFTTSMYPAQSGAQSTTDGMSFASSQPPSTVSPNFQTPGSAPDTSTPQVDGLLAANPQMDLNALFDPSNPALYNFDLEGLNFGSQYAGWEFGILNKMGLGAETPPRENSISQSTPTDYTGVFGNNNNNGGGAQQGFDGTGTMMAPFSTGMDKTQTMYTQGNLQHGLPHAYAIAAGPTSLASPSTDATASPQNMTGMSPGNNGFGAGSKPTTPRVKPKQLKPNQMPQSSILGKRPARDTASVYDNVKEPYPYTAGFHNMVQVLRKRLPLNKLLRIAMTLAEIRPSFISSTKDLTREDLVFMEKCFQRTLIEFDDFLQHCCAPTIVCRRSGEVAAVNKEFTALTGWTKKVLLGKETNRHAAHARLPSNGSSKSDSKADDKTAAAGGGAGGSKDAWPQPVFLAELMDDDSIVEFYKDFSQLAFEDSRGRVQRSCRLIQYRPEEGDTEAGRKKAQERQQKGMLSNRVTTIDGEHGISRIEQDGKVACTYCWTIKRDVFDIPMMIIINVSPDGPSVHVFVHANFCSSCLGIIPTRSRASSWCRHSDG